MGYYFKKIIPISSYPLLITIVGFFLGSLAPSDTIIQQLNSIDDAGAQQLSKSEYKSAYLDILKQYGKTNLYFISPLAMPQFPKLTTIIIFLRISF